MSFRNTLIFSFAGFINSFPLYLRILLVNEELVDEDQNQQVLGVSKPRSTAYIST
ncbi:hypothetical protein [Candidatus Tisiphia endosymbiont of Ditula angustiorana]|uniref:hypothetical protein n=1 Tax=Candidatus Tisiphia endosymbiont of Ditula angustiorana TaxID=3066272 RepID=UPI00312C8AD2